MITGQDVQKLGNFPSCLHFNREPDKEEEVGLFCNFVNMLIY